MVSPSTSGGSSAPVPSGAAANPYGAPPPETADHGTKTMPKIGDPALCSGPKLAPFNPTSDEVIQLALDFYAEGAGVTDRDVFFDLGCGDGRVVGAFVKRFADRLPRAAIGIEYDPVLFEKAQERLESCQLLHGKTRTPAALCSTSSTAPAILEEETAATSGEYLVKDREGAVLSSKAAGQVLAAMRFGRSSQTTLTDTETPNSGNENTLRPELLLADVCGFRTEIAETGTIFFVYLVPEGMKHIVDVLETALTTRKCKVVSYVFRLPIENVAPTKVEKFKSIPVYCYEGCVVTKT
ncbi:unnamed protein product [Amoebophrya sp. A120]|nr:unnamed protein product [Amoebophrya sp. A120]|eukprot:GSA120T00001694001.1